MKASVWFVWFDSFIPVNNFSVMSGQVFLGWTCTKQRFMCLAKGHNAVTPVSPSVWSQALYHRATTLHEGFCVLWQFVSIVREEIMLVKPFRAIHNKCGLLSYLLMYFGILYCNYYGLRSGFIVFASKLKKKSWENLDSGLNLNSGFWDWLSTERQRQNAELRSL